MSRAMLHFGFYTLPDSTTRYACAVASPDAPGLVLALVYTRRYLIGTACRDFEEDLRVIQHLSPNISRFLDNAVFARYSTSELPYADNWHTVQSLTTQERI